VTGWTLAEIEELSLGDVWEFDSVRDARTKAMRAAGKRR